MIGDLTFSAFVKEPEDKSWIRHSFAFTVPGDSLGLVIDPVKDRVWSRQLIELPCTHKKEMA